MAKINQGSPEWLAERIGKLTASRASAVVGRTAKGKPTADYQRYLMELIAERLTGLSAPHFVSAEMMWSSEHGPSPAPPTSLRPTSTPRRSASSRTC